MNYFSVRAGWMPGLSPRRLVAFAATRTGVLGLTTVGNLVVRTVSSMLLTRLLAPKEFGIVGIITSVFFAAAMVTDLGFQDFLIRHDRTEDSHFRNVIWSIHAKRGVAIFAGIALGSPVIAWAFGKPPVALPLAVASFIFVLNGVSSLSLMTALRHDKSRELSLLEFSLQVFQTCACILLALWWHNAWSIIAAMLLQSGLRTILSYRLFEDSAQHFAHDRAISREFLVFSRFVMTGSVLALVIGQSDKIVLGRVFTLGEFGIYAIALTIASAPVAFAQSYVNRIVFPICAQTWRQNAGELATAYYRVRRLPAALYAFACGGLIGSAAFVVALLYDRRYAGASTFVSLLMIGTALRLPNVAASQLMVAVGQVKKTMHMTVVRLLWILVTIPAGFFVFGPIGVVASMGLMEVPAMFYCWPFLRRIGVLDLREELSYLALVAAGATIGFIGGTEILRLFPHL
ncbi:MAG: oligosaccharide flippase family protein [Sphingomicrobium sp.]